MQVKLLLVELCRVFDMSMPPDLEQKLSFNALPPPSPAAGSVAPDARDVSFYMSDSFFLKHILLWKLISVFSLDCADIFFGVLDRANSKNGKKSLFGGFFCPSLSPFVLHSLHFTLS